MAHFAEAETRPRPTSNPTHSSRAHPIMIISCLALCGCQSSEPERSVSLGTMDAIESIGSDIFEAPDGTLHLDKASIVQSREGNSLAWLRISLDSEGTLSDGTTFTRAVMRIEVDCTERRSRSVDEAHYYDSSGEVVVRHTRSSARWSALAPMTTGERIGDLVCDG